jgi:hypothetical protein
MGPFLNSHNLFSFHIILSLKVKDINLWVFYILFLKFIHGCEEVGILQYHGDVDCVTELWKGKFITSIIIGNFYHQY